MSLVNGRQDICTHDGFSKLAVIISEDTKMK